MEKKQLLELPFVIEGLESKQTEINQQIAMPEFYQQDQQKINRVLDTLEKINTELEQVYVLWGKLEALAE